MKQQNDLKHAQIKLKTQKDSQKIHSAENYMCKRIKPRTEKADVNNCHLFFIS